MSRYGLIARLSGLGIVTICCITALAQPVIFPNPLSPRIANYDINVKLDTEKRMLYGSETLTWFNKSADTITELQFHLYLNAFRNSKSTFMKESRGISRGFKLDKEGWGFIEVNKITLPSGEDLTERMEFIQPDDGNPDDKTVFRLPLPKPLAPGKSIVLNMDFTARLPEPPFARTGAKKEYFFVGQWFPKIGVYIDGKWNCHQFHAYSEFFADFGVYNVRITVPEKNIVGATGLEVEVEKNGDGTATHFYHAEDVHDFAWTTSPEFVEFKGKAQDVEIRVLMQPDHADQGPRHLEAAKAAVEYFQNWYGDYPFPNLTVVDPRRGASGSGGMEYPTLITAGTNYGLPKGVRAVEMVIIHEFGHNFWYHLLASNEFEESWMDEGINTYTEIQIMNDKYGPVGDGINFLGIKINDLQFQRALHLFNADVDPIMRKAWEFYSGGSYNANSYAKPGLVLTTLQNYLGKEMMQKIMRTYVERWRFKHPQTQDFITVANEVSGQDLNWFFDQALFSNAILDYGVERIFTREVKKGEGYDFTLMASKPDSLIRDDKGRSDAVAAKSKPKIYESGFYVRRLGMFKFPVEIVATFEGGEKVHEKWDGQELWKKFTYLKPNKLVSATVDPENKIPLDLNYTNNSKAVQASSLGVNKLSARWLFWMQFLLDQPEFLNILSAITILF
ncbi:MAG: M1 family metallopeptidase [candidate division KSB1 bacterium]|nr:M1 family metallopeptidase [candidate division KSB1 bacterium]MDZ7312764.1 M1 family metallopeptidase [candidate division KSB1 bacterium]